MTVEYRDETPFTGDNHTPTELANAIRTKKNGKAVREPIAQLADKLDSAIKGQNIGSVVATPTKVFANLSALQSTYPNGADGVMVTVDTGHKYFWQNNSWLDGGAYQTDVSSTDIETIKFNDDEENNANQPALSTLNPGKYSLWISTETGVADAVNSGYPEVINWEYGVLEINRTSQGFFFAIASMYNGDHDYRLVYNFKNDSGWQGWQNISTPKQVTMKDEELRNFDTLKKGNYTIWYSTDDNSLSEFTDLGYPEVKNYVKSTYFLANLEIQSFNRTNWLLAYLKPGVNYSGFFYNFKNDDGWQGWQNIDDSRRPLKVIDTDNLTSDLRIENLNPGTYFLWIKENSRDDAYDYGYPFIEGYDFGILTVNDNTFREYIYTSIYRTNRFFSKHDSEAWKVSESNTNFFSGFKKFGVIGDSLSYGWLSYLPDDLRNTYKGYGDPFFSWGGQLARKYGNTCLTYAKSGMQAKNWLSDEICGVKFENDAEIAEIYTIMLGVNDAVDLSTAPGTTSDISIDNNTFASNYAKIIRKIHEKNSKAVVCIYTIPVKGFDNLDARKEDFNNVIRTISKQSEFESYVILVDLEKMRQGNYDDIHRDHSNGSHESPIGYGLMASVIENATAEVWRHRGFRSYSPYQLGLQY